MAEKKTTKKSTKKQEVDKEHDVTITLMTGALIVLASTAAIVLACLIYLRTF